MSQVELGEGLVLTRTARPRPRRVPTPEPKPFDAKERLDSERSLPHRERSTTALLVELKQLCASLVHPSAIEDRRQAIDQVVVELETRAVPVDDVLTDRLAVGAVVALTIAVAVRRISGEDAAYVPAGIEAFVLGEAGVTDLVPSSDAADDEEVLTSIMAAIEAAPARGRLLTWMRSVGRDAVFGLVGPDDESEIIGRRPSRPTEFEEASDGPWLVDRFTETYLEDWSTASLKREWHWVHSQAKPPIGARQMKERVIDEASLACEIADRAARDERKSSDDKAQRLGVDYVALAASLLSSGDRSAAAALFAHAALVDERTPDMVQNQAFCLVPDKPQEALSLLREAAAMGYRPLAVNQTVLSYALLAQGALTEARNAHERAISRLDEVPPWFTAYMWSLPPVEGADPSLVTVRLRDYVADLGDMLSQAQAETSRDATPPGDG